MQSLRNEVFFKFSSECISNGNGINQEVIDSLAGEIVQFGSAEELKPNIVTGGAVAEGEHYLADMGFDTSSIPKRVLAANGLERVAGGWSQAFRARQRATGLVVLTHREIDDLGDESLGIGGEGAAIKTAHQQLSGQGIIPIFNQNDAIAIDDEDNELTKFKGGGDNDWLVAHLGIHLGARAVFFLTSDVWGVEVDGDVQSIVRVDEIDDLDEHFYDAKKGGSGDIRSKLEAAGALAVSDIQAFVGNYRDDLYSIYTNRSGTQVIQ